MAKAAVKERPRKSAADSKSASCQHHWTIETPAGSLSKGVCRRCGAERDFRNSADGYMWEDDSKGKGYSPWRGTRPATKNVADDTEQIPAAGV